MVFKNFESLELLGLFGQYTNLAQLISALTNWCQKFLTKWTHFVYFESKRSPFAYKLEFLCVSHEIYLKLDQISTQVFERQIKVSVDNFSTKRSLPSFELHTLRSQNIPILALLHIGFI